MMFRIVPAQQNGVALLLLDLLHFFFFRSFGLFNHSFFLPSSFLQPIGPFIIRHGQQLELACLIFEIHLIHHMPEITDGAGS
ncbi:hypothetical protein EDB81DRAFT_807808 [Dactylonectria macrodidyma]|uniref:Uncharacterized protein n=1 Tax=Dactylonectria macrodidyma TaxID=307937 RepID=A0A9P9IU47_9HYPO|nr:hypothetical protein EDB81DRAFT_807808 [Dactylonectria macrodidyma]